MSYKCVRVHVVDLTQKCPKEQQLTAINSSGPHPVEKQMQMIQENIFPGVDEPPKYLLKMRKDQEADICAGI